MNSADVKIGFLHPGSMGVSIAAAAVSAGVTSLWASQGRSEATAERARVRGLVDAGTIADLVDESDVIFSVCPPAAAGDVARAVAGAGFSGVYVDANAISPPRMKEVAGIITAGGGEVVDGAIIGHPAWMEGTTYLHLSGPRAGEIAPLFKGSVLGTAVLSETVGDASALKMCYAALTKGTAALTAAILATAEELGVRDALNEQWDADGTGRAKERADLVRGVPAKAWRWVDEMEEIARTFEAAGLPGGFHKASADVFRRLEDMKHGPHPSDLEAVLGRLRKRGA